MPRDGRAEVASLVARACREVVTQSQGLTALSQSRRLRTGAGGMAEGTGYRPLSNARSTRRWALGTQRPGPSLGEKQSANSPQRTQFPCLPPSCHAAPEWGCTAVVLAPSAEAGSCWPHLSSVNPQVTRTHTVAHGSQHLWTPTAPGHAAVLVLSWPLFQVSPSSPNLTFL